MKKSLIFILLSFVFTAEVEVERALTIAENFHFSKNDPRTTEFNFSTIEQYELNNDEIFHIINLVPSGFILIAANDVIRPVLAYSYENNFELNSIPENIKYIFNLYSNEINEQKNLGRIDNEIILEWDKYSEYVEYEGQNRTVAPLISARFDQGSAWNDMCPEDSDGPGGNVLVGCVAVSMAQIMHYWSYPEIGNGSHGYNHWTYGYQSANFGNSFYNYDEMPSNYASTESQELLYHCGVAVNMGYGTDGSGASVFGSHPSTYYAMRNYFSFKNDMSQVYPGNYSTSQFRNMLQDQLDENKPLIYVGYDGEGGHAWNIDGYDDDYFHNNWGWGGYQNGYFLLSSLNGFNYDQGALINIEPESLDNPNVVLQDFNYEEQVGDGDSVANPGETINLYVTVENLIPWDYASSADLVITTEDPDLNIINDYVYLNNLSAGDDYTNFSNPFIIEFSDDISFTSHQLELNIISSSPNGNFDNNLFYIDINVSMQQAGFPYTVTLIDDETGLEYNAVTTIQSSPKLIDINNDNYPEIFFGDDNGYFHGVDYLGNNLDGFPVQLEGSTNDIWGSPAIGDIDNDNEIELIITSKNNHCYIIDQYGNIELDFETDEFLMGTPSLANLDNDNFLEIVFTGYTNSGKVYAINHTGSYVNNFPVSVNDKILRGASIYDINSNGKDDIVIATESDKLINIIYDNGTMSNIFTSENKFKSAPSIVDVNGNILIVVGDEDGHLYGMDINGNLHFDLHTQDNIRSEVGFIEINNQLAIFSGSEDGHLYAIDANGNNIEGWPQYIGDFKINSSPVFADVDNDGDAEVISATENGHLLIYHLDGTAYANYPILLDIGFISSPTIMDIDNDDDLEIIIGTTQNLSIFDIKESTSQEQYYWYTYKGDLHNTGSYITNSSNNVGDLNADGTINIQDLVITINIIIGATIPSNDQIISGDVNGDNTIDVLDVVLIVNMILN